MILYFADRHLNIIGQASSKLPRGLRIAYDNKIEDVETGVASFECDLSFSNIKKGDRAKVSACAAVGNYILRQSGDADKVDEFYTIIESEEDTKSHEVRIYAEDAGLDLLNEIVGEYEADKAYPIAHYVNKFAYDSGFKIGVNEAADLTRKLSWDGESTATERLASVATQFDGCELSYSFEIESLRIKNKYINIHKERGKDIGAEVRLNKDVDSIVSTKSIANLATALKVTGGTPEATDTEEDPQPITLNGYKYDDGDFFLEGTYLKSRKAVEKWSRYLVEDGDYTGHICKTFTYDTTSQSELCNRAIAELKKRCEIEVNYEVDITKLPENAKIGDRINIVDDDGGLYLSARILKFEVSETDGTKKATLGEYLIKKDGIHQKVAALAEQFAKSSQSAARALAIANAAKSQAVQAQTQANEAVAGAVNAQNVANEAKTAADAATESANEAQTKANAATEAVDKVEEDVASIEKTVNDANAAAEQARQAAATAETKASEAQTAALEAKEQAAAAEEAAGVAKTNSETAISKADGAKTTADQAKQESAGAKETAEAAKLDAEQAEKDVALFGENLTTLSNTMQADYARKTELTETEASLQSQITQNAGQIQSTVTKVTEVDETANNAAQQAAQAQSTATAAQEQANKATEDAEAAQKAADDAALAATNAQSEADKAKAAADVAQSVADKAEEDLAAAKADLETVQGRVDATEEDIATAQQAVNTAQAAADKAKVDAADATAKANAAQTTADTAVTNAATAQTKANEAASAAAIAQQTADAAKGDATAAQAAADKAAEDAAEAQRTADTAVTNAANAQTKANEAAAAAQAAQTAADDADAKAQQAATDLATAQQNLIDVTSRVDATEEEVEAAQAAVETAQAAADKAKADAATAQQTANTAKTNAANAQTAADNAKKAADDAQAAADAAQQAADDAQAAVDALEIRVTKTETDIIQTSERIALLATREEVTTTLGGYYTKTETDAAIEESAEEISLSVSEVREEVENINIGGRNLIAGTSLDTVYTGNKGSGSSKDVWAAKTIDIPTATEYVVSFDAKADAAQTIKCFFYNPNTTISAESSTGYKNASVADGNSEVNITTEWQRYWVKWTQTAANATKSVIVGRTFSDSNIYIRAVKLEEGNRPTSWTPAPEDQDAATEAVADNLANNYYTKTQTDAQIKVSSDSITSTVSSTYATKTALDATDTKAANALTTASNAQAAADNAQDAADDAQITANNAQGDIDNLNIGGRNLLLNTNGTGDIIVDGGTVATAGITERTNDGILTLNCATEATEIYYRFMNPGSSSNNLYTLKAGETYTFSGKAMITVESGTLIGLIARTQAYRLGGWSGGINRAIATAETTDWVDFEYSFTVESDATGYYVSFQINYSGSFAGVAQFKDLKLEHGTRATDWTPAPEDVDSDIQSVSDVANGLVDNMETILGDGTEDNIGLIETLRTEIHQTDEDWKLAVTKTQENIDTVDEKIDDVQGTVNEYSTWFTMDEDGFTIVKVENGVEQSLKVRIDNDSLDFLDGDTVVAYVSNEKLMINAAEVKGLLDVGSFRWTSRANGNMGLMWIGG